MQEGTSMICRYMEREFDYIKKQYDSTIVFFLKPWIVWHSESEEDHKKVSHVLRHVDVGQ